MGAGHISFTKRGGSKASRREDGYAIMAEVANHYYEEDSGWFQLRPFHNDLIDHFHSLGFRNTPTMGEVKSHLFFLKRKGLYERRQSRQKGKKIIEYRLCSIEPNVAPQQGCE
tara:strand:- start:4103 stop:4441 length:339 start_codon:yes stop_codon:yes gene_type:complete